MFSRRRAHRDEQRVAATPGDDGRAVIGLLGLFGVGNLGNDGSLEVGLQMVEEYAPDAEAVCITPSPQYISERYGIRTLKMREPRRLPGWMAATPGTKRTLLRPLSEAKRWVDTYRAVRQLSLVFVPGTGVLDDFGLRPQGVPYILFRWALCARLARTPFAFVGIGAGPIKNPKSRRLMVWAARLATHRSYRDIGSRNYMADLGAPGRLTPDIVFADRRLPPTALSPAPAVPTGRVAVGVMSYRGWSDDVVEGADAADRYVGRLVELVGRLLDLGLEVTLVIGAESDLATVDDVVEGVGATGRDMGRVHTPTIASLEDLCVELAATDAAVVTRYHNLVCSLITARPCVAIGYEQRFDELKIAAGFPAYGHRTGSFEIDRVLDDLCRASRNVADRVDDSTARLARFDREIRDDFSALLADR